MTPTGRKIAAGLAVLIAAFFLCVVLEFGFDRGPWVCSTCGAHERCTSFYGLTISSNQEESPYHDWYTSNVALPHHHDWLRSGCHPWGGWILPLVFACSPEWNRCGFFEILPYWRDRDRAIQVAKRLASLDEESRRSELADSKILSQIAFFGIEPPLPDRYANLYREWRANHPVWKDLLPD